MIRVRVVIHSACVHLLNIATKPSAQVCRLIWPSSDVWLWVCNARGCKHSFKILLSHVCDGFRAHCDYLRHPHVIRVSVQVIRDCTKYTSEAGVALKLGHWLLDWKKSAHVRNIAMVNEPPEVPAKQEKQVWHPRSWNGKTSRVWVLSRNVSYWNCEEPLHEQRCFCFFF